MKMPRAIARIPPAALEALESRRLLAATPVGPEFRVNEHTVGLGVVGGARAGDADADGDFVVVWNDFVFNEFERGALVMARLYDRNGTPRGGEFRVNAPTQGWLASPSVAMDDRGDFVVVYGGMDYLYNVHARRFDASGAPLGPEFRVNTTEGSATQGVQWTSVAMDADGDFVVVWWVLNPTLGGGVGVRGQRFNAAGQPQGEEFRVDDVGGPPFWTPHVAMDAAGDFVVGWSDSGAWARRYSASGAPLGPGFAVGDSAFATVPVMAADGRSAVVWGGDNGPLLARRYDAAGNPQGDLIEVAPQGSTDLMASMNASGEFVVSWGNSEVHTRSFDAQGRPTGDAFRVEPSTVYRKAATPALDDEGDLVVVWTTSVLDEHNNTQEDVWARRFDLDPSPSVAARRVFYDNSGFDGNTPGGNAADDAAVATDKVALPRGQWGGLANVTSYDKGLNGIMVDVARLPAGAALTADDFAFRTGTSADRSAWRAGPRPSGVAVRRGAGVNGTDRVTLTWPAYDPRSGAADPAAGNAWLEVTVKANANTGLASPDVFCFGNLVGETGNFAERMSVNAVDLTRVRAAQRSAAPVTSAFDFNRDGRVNVVDLGIARSNFGRALQVAEPEPLTVSEPLTAAAPRVPGRRATRKPARLDVLGQA